MPPTFSNPLPASRQELAGLGDWESVGDVPSFLLADAAVVPPHPAEAVDSQAAVSEVAPPPGMIDPDRAAIWDDTNWLIEAANPDPLYDLLATGLAADKKN